MDSASALFGQDSQELNNTDTNTVPLASSMFAEETKVSNTQNPPHMMNSVRVEASHPPTLSQPPKPDEN